MINTRNNPPAAKLSSHSLAELKEQKTSSHELLEIKYQIDITTLPPQTDFWILGKNVLLTPFCEHGFDYDVASIQAKHYIPVDDTPPFLKLKGEGDQGINPWIRDLIATKTEDAVYAFTKDVKYDFLDEGSDYIREYDKDIVKNNRNIASYITSNKCGYYYLHPTENISTLHPTKILTAGGNLFHCVNARGEKYAIVGESGLVQQHKLKKENNFKTETLSTVGAKSAEKYGAAEFKEKTEIIQLRQQNKQILKSQLGDTKLVIVPNSFFFHIDLEMCVLPNGVVLLHSHQESLNLIEANEAHVSETLKKVRNISSGSVLYKDLHLRINAHLEETENLFEITAQKLTKRGFIVIPVCGFLTFKDNAEGVFATGFNGLPVVLQDGKILYTSPQNPEWYQAYFNDILKKAGVSIIEPIQSKSLEFIREYEGFFRCQTNTIPKKLVDAHRGTKRKAENSIQPGSLPKIHKI